MIFPSSTQDAGFFLEILEQKIEKQKKIRNE